MGLTETFQRHWSHSQFQRSQRLPGRWHPTFALTDFDQQIHMVLHQVDEYESHYNLRIKSSSEVQGLIHRSRAHTMRRKSALDVEVYILSHTI
jgi:hypothetical protein